MVEIFGGRSHIPHAELAPIVDDRNPAARGVVLRFVLIVVLALYLQNQSHAVRHPHEVVGDIVMLYSEVLVGNQQIEVVVLGVVES